MKAEYDVLVGKTAATEKAAADAKAIKEAAEAA